MEHFKSTLATTAIAAFGLVAAAHILHPGNFERTTYPSRPVATVASQQAAWVSPPAGFAAEVAKTEQAKVEVKPDVMKSASAEPVPVAWTSAKVIVPSAEAAPAVEPVRKAAAHRRKVAHRPAPVRQANLERQAAQPAAAAPAPSTTKADRIDPIGDIIRGLGLGSDS